MSFLDDVFGRNPTRDWQPQRGLELVCDLDNETFCGVAFGERVERLSKLGPTEVAGTARKGIYEYPSRGFTCIAEDGKFVEVELSFVDEAPLAVFGGIVQHRGRPVPLSRATTETEVRAAFGDPRERKEQGIGGEPFVQLTYGLYRSDWIFAFEDGGLDSLWGGRKD